MKLLDTAFGCGSFWRDIDKSQYDLTFSDVGNPRPSKDKVHWNVDAARLPKIITDRAPYHALIFDPPYVHGPKSYGTVSARSTSHFSVDNELDNACNLHVAQHL